MEMWRLTRPQAWGKWFIALFERICNTDGLNNLREYQVVIIEI